MRSSPLMEVRGVILENTFESTGASCKIINNQSPHSPHPLSHPRSLEVRALVLPLATALRSLETWSLERGLSLDEMFTTYVFTLCC